MIKVAGYARASTNKQEMTPVVQEEVIRRWYEDQSKLGKWDDEPAEFVGMFIDEAVSSRIHLLDRPAGQEIPVLLGRGDILVFAKFNRAFRGAADTERTLSVCNEAGINLVFLDLAIDTTTANGRLQAGILSVVSAHQRDQISEVTKESLHSRREHGVLNCSGRVARIGWKTNGERDEQGYLVLVPDEHKRQISRHVLKMVQKKTGEKKIHAYLAKMTNARPSRSTPRQLACAAALDFPKLSVSHIKEVLGDRIGYPTYKFCRDGNLAFWREMIQAEERRIFCPSNKIFYKRRR